MKISKELYDRVSKSILFGGTPFIAEFIIDGSEKYTKSKIKRLLTLAISGRI